MQDIDRDALVASAIRVRKNAYAPYSGFRVGSAVMCDAGNIYNGVNAENASYGLAICAERGAAMDAVSRGRTQLVAVAIASKGAVAPCGACRQFLYEFGPEMKVFLVDPTAPNDITELVLSDLLPRGFSDGDMR